MSTVLPPEKSVRSLDDEANTSGYAIGHGASARGDGENQPLQSLSERKLWHSNAPGSLRTAWKKDPQGIGWDTWAEHLAKVKPKADGVDLLKAATWGLDDQTATAVNSPQLATGKSKNEADAARLEEASESWIEQSLVPAAGQPSLEFAIAGVAWAYAAPAAAKHLELDAWWRLIDHLRGIASSALNQSVEDDWHVNQVLLHQLLACEVPIALGTLMPELRPLRELHKRAINALSETLVTVTDGEGLVPARFLPRLGELLACWTRCRLMNEQNSKPNWSEESLEQYDWLVRQSLRLARPDRTFALGSGTASQKAMLQSALDLGGDDADLSAGMRRLKVEIEDTDVDDEPPEASNNSEWAGLAVLATDWKPKSPRLTVTYEGESMQLELAAGGQVLLCGDWPIDVKWAGQPVQPNDTWDEQCWFSDDDGDYLELSIDLVGGGTLERQIFIAREDNVAYLSEILLSETQQQDTIEIRTSLTLAEGAKFEPAKETREGWLSAGEKQIAGVVPLALPEWRIDPRTGELEQQEDQLVLTHSAAGRNACSALMLDFKPRRFAKQRTWRQLTVAERLEKVDRDVAVSFRMQSGKDQWLVYRTLEPAGNRTFLGQNYACDGVIGKLLPDDEFEEYFELDYD